MQIASNNIIYKSNEFDKFYFIPGNRPICRKHVNTLKDNILSENRLDEHMLSILKEDDRFYIKDGQHRFTACRELNIPFYFVIANSKKESMIDDQISKKWQLKDYLNYFIVKKYPAYIEYQELMEKYRMPLNVIFTLLNINRRDASTNFKSGDLKITNRMRSFLEKTWEFFETYRNRHQDNRKTIINQRDFIAALYWFHNYYKPGIYEIMLKKLDGVTAEIQKKACVENYKLFFVNTYNKGLCKEKTPTKEQKKSNNKMTKNKKKAVKPCRIQLNESKNDVGNSDTDCE